MIDTRAAANENAAFVFTRYMIGVNPAHDHRRCYGNLPVLTHVCMYVVIKARGTFPLPFVLRVVCLLLHFNFALTYFCRHFFSLLSSPCTHSHSRTATVGLWSCVTMWLCASLCFVFCNAVRCSLQLASILLFSTAQSFIFYFFSLCFPSHFWFEFLDRLLCLPLACWCLFRSFFFRFVRL